MPADPTPFTFDFIHSQRSAIDALAAETLEEVTRLQAERDAARARADTLQARLDALLAPVGGEGDEEPVNPEEVLALAQVLARQEAEGVEMYSTTALQAERAVPLAREVVRLRADIKALRQQVAAALADLPENVKRVESDLRAEVDILRRERHAERLRVQERDEEIAELRLTLAAEQGRPEGAPDPAWCYAEEDWGRAYPDGEVAGVYRDGRWYRGVPGESARITGRATSLRAGMIACDKGRG